MCKWRRLGIAALLLASSSVVALAGDSGAGGPARKKNPKKHARRSRLASIAAIDSSSDSSSSRISIRTTKAVRYRVAALRNPRRIYLDLIHTQIAEAAKKALPAGADGPITRIRASQNRAGVTRIVLYASEQSEYSVVRMHAPERLVVDVRAKDEARAAHPVQTADALVQNTPPGADHSEGDVVQQPPAVSPFAVSRQPVQQIMARLAQQQPGTSLAARVIPAAVAPAQTTQAQNNPSSSAQSPQPGPANPAANTAVPAYAASYAFDLKPAVPRASFHIHRPDIRAIFQALADTFQIKFLYDQNFSPARIVGDFDLENVTLRQALDAAGTLSKTFVAPVDEHTAIVANDTPEKHNEYERQVLGTLDVSEQRSPQEITEISTALRTMLDLRRVAQNNAANQITVMGRAHQIDVAREFIHTLEKPPGEVAMDMDILEVDSQKARQLGILPPNNFELVYLGLAAAQPASVLAFGRGRTLYGMNLPGATGSATFSSSVLHSKQNLYLRARDGQEATFTVGERFPVLNGVVSSSFFVNGGTGITLLQVNSVEKTDVSSVSVPFNFNNAAGDLIVVFVRMSDTTQTVSITDSSGNTYHDAVSQAQDSTNEQVHIFYAENIASGANTVKAAFSSTNAHPWVSIYEYNGISATNALDQVAKAEGNSNAPATNAVTTTSANELAFVGMSLPAPSYTGIVEAGSGFLLQQQDTGTSPAATEQAFLTTTGQYAGSFALAPATNWAAVMATFVAAGVPSSSITSTIPGAFPSVQYQDIGVKVKATPHLHASRELTLNFNLELTGIGTQRLNGAPVISSRQVAEQVRLRDGDSYVLGGLLEHDRTAALQGYPWFSRLPLLGYLFGSRTRNNSDSELLLVIRPHVLRLAPAEEYESSTIYFGKELQGLPAPAPEPQPPPVPGPQPVPPGPPPGVQPVPGATPQPGVPGFAPPAQQQPGQPFQGTPPQGGIPQGVFPPGMFPQGVGPQSQQQPQPAPPASEQQRQQ